mmetsp:Transcript_5044/g.16524  ORF Transcript_5044/g.16524 Transcript_5044/m.16524 type:complete len:103 (+) Transcript_5044:331-639(+)
MAGHYFTMLDRDENGGVDESEVTYFVTQMIQLSGYSKDDIDLDDKSAAVDGKTLRQLIEDTFDDIDRNDDNVIHLDEAQKAQRKVAKILGDFIAKNMPNAEF